MIKNKFFKKRMKLNKKQKIITFQDFFGNFLAQSYSKKLQFFEVKT